MKNKNVLSKIFVLVSVAGVTALASTGVHAELPPEVAIEMATATTDIKSSQGLIIGLAVVAMAGRWIKATFF